MNITHKGCSEAKFGFQLGPELVANIKHDMLTFTITVNQTGDFTPFINYSNALTSTSTSFTNVTFGAAPDGNVTFHVTQFMLSDASVHVYNQSELPPSSGMCTHVALDEGATTEFFLNCTDGNTAYYRMLVDDVEVANETFTSGLWTYEFNVSQLYS